MQTIQLILIPLFVVDTEEANFFCYAGMAKVPCHGMIFLSIIIRLSSLFPTIFKMGHNAQDVLGSRCPNSPFPRTEGTCKKKCRLNNTNTCISMLDECKKIVTFSFLEIGIHRVVSHNWTANPSKQFFMCPQDLTILVGIHCFQPNDAERRKCLLRIQKQVYCDFQYQPTKKTCKEKHFLFLFNVHVGNLYYKVILLRK